LATLVLSTVGTALGGPVGSAIGALIGQSIDQELLAPVRRGPRVGDLSVQTSSYGTQVPRIYGAMRVAGTVIWATDLIESEQTDGAKGQPDVTYSYSVSLAVALSSRPVGRVGRIWADGKLLRGAAGDFKVDTLFRFYDGSEDQSLDPLIGSVEGLAATPAYRGIALAVFENLQLADFGNRIPMMTFEVIADEDAPTAGTILEDASGGAIASTADARVTGFAAYGASIGNAVEPLVDCFGVNLFDDGANLRSPASGTPVVVSLEELGNSSDGKQTARVERDQRSARELPNVLRLTYYDPARDYQAGESRAAAGEEAGTETRKDLPAVLEVSDAKATAHAMIARAWANRERLTLRLPPSNLGLEPGNELELALSPLRWVVNKTTVDGFVVIAELHPAVSLSGAIASDAGRIIENSDAIAQPLSLTLLDVPNPLGLASAGPAVLIGATSTSGWQRQLIEVSFGGQSVTLDAARGKAIAGNAVSALAPAECDLIDDRNLVDVTLIDENQWLMSYDDDALAAGKNLAALGNELIQFGDALPLGGGRFRLSRLLRGRGGSEWAVNSHAAGESFCLLKSGTLQPLALPSSSLGAMVSATTRGGATTSLLFLGEGLRPPSPVNLSANRQPSGDLVLSWTRRSRQGFAWLDEIDAPLGEANEQYRVNLSGTAGSAELLAAVPSVTVAAADVTALGPGDLAIELRQIGDAAVSHPAELVFTLS